MPEGVLVVSVLLACVRMLSCHIVVENVLVIVKQFCVVCSPNKTNLKAVAYDD